MIEIKEKLFTSEVKKLIPILGRNTAEKLSRAYLLGDEDTRERIFGLIDVAKAAVFTENELRDSILIEPPEKSVVAKGNLNLGSVLYGKKKLYPFKFEEDRLLMHMGIFGSSGYGKTNLANKMVFELADQDIPVLIFDFSKRNYRNLLKTELKNRIDIYTVGRDASPLKFNPLRPPDGISMSQWMKEFSAVFDHAYWLMGGGRHIIMKAFDGVFDEREKPRLRDIKSWIEEYGDLKLPMREKNWVSTAIRPLESLCFKEIGDIFNCDVGTKPSDFLKKGRITILELDALDTNDKTFFIEIIMQWLRDWLLVSDQREKLRGVIILEEAHHVLNREKANKMGSETVMDLIFREIRELGLGIIYTDQHPSLVSYPALGNTSTHIYMNLGLDTKGSSDIMDASHMLGLDYEEEGVYLRRLPVGHGFMLCRNFEFPRPFLMAFDEVKLDKTVISDEVVANFMKTYEKVVNIPEDNEPEDIDNVNENIEEIEDAVEKAETKPKIEASKLEEISKQFQEATKRMIEDLNGMKEKENVTEENIIEEVKKFEKKLVEKQAVKNEPKLKKEIVKENKHWEDGEDVVSFPIEKLDNHCWNIVDVLGQGHGAFASQVYKAIRVSGTVFNDKISALLDMGLVRNVRGKSGKNKLHYYFLTDKGEKIFHGKFQRYEGKVDMDITELLEMFSLVGWKATRKIDILEINKEDDILPVALIDYTDRSQIYDKLKENRHFICANETLKNIIVQQAAKRSLKKPGLTVFVSTLEDFQQNCKFDKVEFDIR